MSDSIAASRATHFNLFGLRIGRFLSLFLSIILMMALRPLLGGFIRMGILTDILFAAILISGLWAVSRGRAVFIAALLVAIPALVLGWVGRFAGVPLLGALDRVFLIIFMGITLVTLVSHIARAKEGTAEIIMGAASSYFLIGLVWAFTFSLMEKFAPGSFRLPESPIDVESQFVYFSFVTLTTVGYGDITPASMTARYYSVLEAVTGQLYLAVLVSGLVGLFISQRPQGRSEAALIKTSSAQDAPAP
jgi:voltage-gated potassium channel